MEKLSFLFLIILNCGIGWSIEGCRFCYTKLPNATLGCDPYLSVNRSISLICAIERPDSASLDIKWFFQGSDSTNATQISSDSNHTITVNSTETSHQSVMAQSTLTITPFSVGQYWCQAFNGSNGLGKIQRLEIFDDYERLDLEPCTVPIAESVHKCNDIIENGDFYSVCPILSVSSSSSILTTSTAYIESTTSLLYLSSLTFSSSVFDDMPPLSTVFLSSSTTYTVKTSSYLVNPPPSNLPIDPKPRGSFHIWVYVLGGLIGVLVILIIVLSLICIGLCLTKPKGKHTADRRQRTNDHCTRRESEEITNMQRPPTAMTDLIPLSPLPRELDNPSSLYDALDQDYEDLDEQNDTDLATKPPARYHEQGPSIGTSTILRSHPPLQQTYSEIGAVGESTHPPHLPSLTGYGKLDHSRPRQNYYPKKDSPLLSGYRKLEHVQNEFRATTLPQQSGYANIDVPGTVQGGHMRSISLPNSEYSNLNQSRSSSEPNTPFCERPMRKRYANFEIIEANSIDGMDDTRESSDDYHMLSDATAEQVQEEYEYLPSCDDELHDLERSPEGLHLSLGKEHIHNQLLGSLSKDPLAEKISVASSQSSADFTGPFFFPHMATQFDEAISPDSSDAHHLYKPLDVSTMDPEKSYAMISVQKLGPTNH
ncbi:PREDICTED: uncharacterized protein LOC109583397 [Amphimedon queenslandica]|uniref:Ig-like domain-containing protein n=1 Tax=Amphimedon queenslandica TaxID=400682 RepID=A0A1X7UH43_AMPQE|nr:PREDICTED: uncharacterized protein LOC109583397 [Amphimedon queenslandica]|eukprot:XP_019854281.1 PREDICTED: uncharacterized protein LOC109583397 [Amphimedon queenslandica]